MLLDLGCKYVILGHSERRHTLGESDAFINQKVRVALAAGLDVIFCCGETLDEREAGQTEAVLDRQLIRGLAGLSPDTLTRLTIAYEPVWAIGSLGHEATPSRLRRRTLSLGVASVRFSARNRLKRLSSSTAAASSRRTPPPLSQPGVDGALIGGASLHAEQFLAIVRAGISESQAEGKR